jgi:hypothetical protein
LRQEYGEFDHVAMLFHYANHSTGMLSHSSYLSPDQNHFTIYGSAGTIAVEPRQLLVRKHGQEARAVELPADDGNVNMWNAIADAFHQQRVPFYTGAKALQDVMILEKVDQAIHQNQVMHLADADLLGHHE